MADLTRSQIAAAIANGGGKNFAGMDLAGVDMSNLDLIDADFTNANVSGTKFTGARLSDQTKFDGANVSKADFRKATMIMRGQGGSNAPYEEWGGRRGVGETRATITTTGEALKSWISRAVVNADGAIFADPPPTAAEKAAAREAYRVANDAAWKAMNEKRGRFPRAAGASDGSDTGENAPASQPAFSKPGYFKSGGM